MCRHTYSPSKSESIQTILLDFDSLYKQLAKNKESLYAAKVKMTGVVKKTDIVQIANFTNRFVITKSNITLPTNSPLRIACPHLNTNNL